MEIWMNDKEKKFVEVICAITVWVLLFFVTYSMTVSGMLSKGLDIVASDSLLRVMVIEIIISGLIMGLAYTTYIITKQNIALKKAQKIIANEEKEETSKEYIVE